MAQKGVYSYDYMDSFDKFNQTTLPTKEQFFSQLNNEFISDDDYKHAKKVWRGFNLKSVGQYYDLYLLSNILLLAEVFKKFQENVFTVLQNRPSRLFYISWPIMGCNVKDNRHQIRTHA